MVFRSCVVVLYLFTVWWISDEKSVGCLEKVMTSTVVLIHCCYLFVVVLHDAKTSFSFFNVKNVRNPTVVLIRRVDF